MHVCSVLHWNLTRDPFPPRSQPAAAALVTAGAAAAAATRACAAKVANAEKAMVRTERPHRAIAAAHPCQVRAPFEGAAARCAEVSPLLQRLQHLTLLSRSCRVTYSVAPVRACGFRSGCKNGKGCSSG